MIDLQEYNYNKTRVVEWGTYSRNPINYSAGMAEDQKDRTYNTLPNRIRISG